MLGINAGRLLVIGNGPAVIFLIQIDIAQLKIGQIIFWIDFCGAAKIDNRLFSITDLFV